MGATSHGGWEGRGGEKARPIHVHQRVAVFVDELNMYWSAKSLYQKKVNYQALLEKIASGRALMRATAYIVRTPETVSRSSCICCIRRGTR